MTPTKECALHWCSKVANRSFEIVCQKIKILKYKFIV